jgi:hypothetical protein
MIVVKNYKGYIDIMRFLYQYFVKKDKGRAFYDDRLRLHLQSHKEFFRRESALYIANTLYNNELNSKYKAFPKRECTEGMVEAHLVHKLYLLLE